MNRVQVIEVTRKSLSPMNSMSLKLSQTVAEQLTAEHAIVFLLDQGASQFVGVLENEARVVDIRITTDSCLVNSISTLQEALLSTDFIKELDEKLKLRVQSSISAIMNNSSNEPLGFVLALNKMASQGDAPMEFTAPDLQLLQKLTCMAGWVVEQTLQVDKVQVKKVQLKSQFQGLQTAYAKVCQDNHRLQSSYRSWRITKKRAVTTAVMIFLSGFLYLFFAHSFNTAPETWYGGGMQQRLQSQLISPQVERVEDFLHLSGNLQPLSWVKVNAPLDAAIEHVNFQYGDTVHQGQLLLELDQSSIQLAHRDATAAYFQSLKELERLKNWSNSIEVKNAKRAVVRANKALQLAKERHASTSSLFQKGIVARTELDSDWRTVSEAEVTLAMAQESLIAQRSVASDVQLKIAQLSLQNAEQKMQSLALQVDQANIHSPVQGIILPATSKQEKQPSKGGIYSGAQVAKNEPLVMIADMSGVSIDSQVNEVDLLKIKPGQSVDVRIEALNDLSLSGVIHYVDARASAHKGSRSRVFNIQIQVKQLTKRQRNMIRIGMSVDTRVLIYSNPEALVIPFSAVQLEGNKKFVWVQTEQGQVIRKYIEIRSSLPQGLEVSSGLSAADKIVIGHGESTNA
ncbi:efflux RND transporter periplasmic adaptor subunit [Pseudoalteromonas obscura]|uniref:Efflux RND transporter periplasmic adaptor subunit n=1 Tax=Pseudoalteromonas obscura TaxID=3048491 RepID=A0ABT7EKM9_9GAMM|nr:efflux RND transporter periplasmic adaptor subunit [Pseudoalteromonas sp. P94(2023)]MDK2595602.1 efflux RND transporter periplasmic adaptor subunit [Pseudoalteromonas sp. P94(2023)]